LTIHPAKVEATPSQLSLQV